MFTAPYNPDIQAKQFNRRIGEFSLRAEYAFEKHLKRLFEHMKREKALNPRINLWYGTTGMER